MKYHDKKILCLEYEEYVSCFNIEIYKSDKKRNRLIIHGRGCLGHGILIEYETLHPERKQALKEKYGNPYEYIAKQPLVDYVKANWDWEAEKFFNDFILPNKLRLPEIYVSKYAKAATWLKAIDFFTTDKRALKRELNISIETFWQLASDLVRIKEVALPANPRRLKDKLKEFKSTGNGSLIETWRFGNNNSKKVKDKVSEALLLMLIAHPHKHDDTIIALKYNEWAVNNGREAITPGAVGYRRKKTELLTTLTREGSAINYNKFSRRIERDRPSAPMLLVNSDDNVLDLYFRDGDNAYKRYTLYLVVDAFNDLILGYSIGETNTIDLIKEAYRNAVHYVNEITGGFYLWHQVQTDNWAIDPKKVGPLATFFKNQAHYTPATIKVAQAKYIERTFGVTWHQQLKFFPNYSGFNITAKERMNPDAIQIAKKDYPGKAQAPAYIAKFIENMRHTVNPKTGLARKDEWLQAFASSEKSRLRPLDTEKRLQLFGVTNERTNKITAGGIKTQINGVWHSYDIADSLYMANVGKSVNVTYDPYCMEQVLISDGNGLRFVTGHVVKAPGALADYVEGTRTHLNSRLAFKKEINEYVRGTMEAQLNILKQNQIDANSYLQAGVTVKEVSHQAQKVLTGSQEEVYDWREHL